MFPQTWENLVCFRFWDFVCRTGVLIFLGLLNICFAPRRLFSRHDCKQDCRSILDSLRLSKWIKLDPNRRRIYAGCQNVEKKVAKDALFGEPCFLYFQFRDRKCHPCLHTGSLMQTREKVWQIWKIERLEKVWKYLHEVPSAAFEISQTF